MLLVTYIILAVILIAKKTTQERKNLLEKIGDISIFLLVYNGIIGLVLSFIGLKLSSFNIALINSIVILILGIWIIKVDKKKIEELSIDIKDLIAIFIVSLGLVIVCKKLYGFDFNISFETTDPATHMHFINQLIKNEEMILTFNSSLVYPGTSSYPFLHYLNNYIFYKVTGIQEVYVSYIIFNLVLLGMFAGKGYFVIKKILKQNNKLLISLGLVILLVSGYGLNTVIFGFSSQLIIYPILLLIIDILQTKKYQEMKLWEKTLLGIILLGIFFGYYYYVPEIFFTIGLYVLIDNIKNKDRGIAIAIQKTIKDGLAIFFIPIIGGFIYLFGFTAEGVTTGANVSHLAVEGYIWRDLFNTLLIFIPFIIYLVIDSIQKKDNNFLTTLIIVSLAFSGILLWGGMNQQVSSYYFFKNHYVLIIPAVLILAQIFYLTRNHKTIYYTIVSFFIIIGVLIRFEGEIYNNNLLFNPTAATSNNVYWFNVARLNNPTTIYTSYEIETINEFLANKKEYAKNEKIAVVGDLLQLRWFEQLTDIWPKFNREIQLWHLDEPVPVDMVEFENDTNYQYILVFERRLKEWCQENIDYSKYEVIIQNNDSYLLKKK